MTSRVHMQQAFDSCAFKQLGGQALNMSQSIMLNVLNVHLYILNADPIPILHKASI